MIYKTLEEWMTALRDHVCNEAITLKDGRQYDVADDPHVEHEGKSSPLVGYVCRGCGKLFQIMGMVITQDPSYEGDFKELFRSVEGRMKLATMLSIKQSDASIEEATAKPILEMPKGPSPNPEVETKPDVSPTTIFESEPEGNKQTRRLLEWEKIDDNGFEWRAAVPGGWIIKVLDYVVHFNDGQRRDGYDWRPAMTFLPDPEHNWGKKEE
ncbi:MAG: hypothetical protein DRN95_07635 [Candidatus Hydrothermarchaeota archaeon]|nr:MAG: hypothetical protein DRN95_07635 [Candidatus Hydrothermarchaeota archaeon]